MIEPGKEIPLRFIILLVICFGILFIVAAITSGGSTLFRYVTAVLLIIIGLVSFRINIKRNKR